MKFCCCCCSVEISPFRLQHTHTDACSALWRAKMRETTNEKQKKKQNHTQAAEQQAEVCMLLYTQMWPVCLLAKHAIVSHNEIELRLASPSDFDICCCFFHCFFFLFIFIQNQSNGLFACVRRNICVTCALPPSVCCSSVVCMRIFILFILSIQ